MTYPTHPIPTTVVGSYPQPDWLIDRSALEHHGVPRVHAHDIWRIPEPWRTAAQDDATILAIQELERAGIDIVSDGEIRRESYSNYFGLSLDGLDTENNGAVVGANRRSTPVPRVVGKIRRKAAVEIGDAEFLVAHATRATKTTIPGPFTLAQQCQNEFYKDEEEMAMDFAVAVNEELAALKATGVDVVQLDEPWVRAAPDKAARYAVRAIDRALQGISGPTIVHICLGYGHLVRNKPAGYAFLPQLAGCSAAQISLEAAQPHLDLGVLKDLSAKTILLGVLDLGTTEIETADTVADRLRAGLRHIDAGRLVAAPDCGMKYLPRAVAFGKLRAMVEGAATVRREIAG
jgi:5-methyltetrahydropteroyltriglutamate--homocysteine methyltransferase